MISTHNGAVWGFRPLGEGQPPWFIQLDSSLGTVVIRYMQEEQYLAGLHKYGLWELHEAILDEAVEIWRRPRKLT